MAQSDLAQVLGGLPQFCDPNVLVGNETADDAGVYRISNDVALVQTVDYFTPIVDNPYDFGAIAAANALSDVYAMGAEPITALNIVGFPVKDLPLSMLHEILRGGGDKCVEAQVAVLGGHSIDDKEPKFGLAVTGKVHPEKILLNKGAKPGDFLVLTKPLGIGILTTGIKRGSLSDDETKTVVDLMAALNRDASEAAIAIGVHAATDVTGYGLLGHLQEMTQGSQLTAEIWEEEIPLLFDKVRTLVAEGVVPGGSKKNLKYVSRHVTFDPDLSPEQQLILADAQTSGGLLLAVAPDRVQDLIQMLQEKKTPIAALIGRLTKGVPGTIQVLSSRT